MSFFVSVFGIKEFLGGEKSVENWLTFAGMGCNIYLRLTLTGPNFSNLKQRFYLLFHKAHHSWCVFLLLDTLS